MTKLAKTYLYWTGCAANFDTRIANVVRATSKVLKAAGIELKFIGGDEMCTGDAARRLGEEGLFQQLALQNIETLKAHEATSIVTHCAHCFHTLKNEYPKFGAEFEVFHHSEVIAMAIEEGLVNLKPTGNADITFHDSCYVGRYNRIFDEPRDVLRKTTGKEIREMPRHAEESFCCGAGGANYWYDAPKKEPVGVIRIKEAASTGAKTVVAECPFCIKMLEQGAQIGGVDGHITVRDIAEVVADALLD